MNEVSAGKRLRVALGKEKPLQLIGVINAYCALLAEHAGFRALYLSGAGVANASHGFPDLGMTDLHDVLEDARRITNATSLPLLVDIDTGFGSVFNIARTIKELTRSGVAAVHIEDQVTTKRCGHRPGKGIVPVEEMLDRLKACVDARLDESFVVMARTDALQSEGMSAAIDRACEYVEAGADMIFAEAVNDIEQYREFIHAVKVPVLANITEFGQTPLYTVEELRHVGVSMALYPLSVFRAMSAAAMKVLATLRTEGTQISLLPSMQTRDELYEHLGYMAFEAQLDQYLHLETPLVATRS